MLRRVLPILLAALGASGCLSAAEVAPEVAPDRASIDSPPKVEILTVNGEFVGGGIPETTPVPRVVVGNGALAQTVQVNATRAMSVNLTWESLVPARVQLYLGSPNGEVSTVSLPLGDLGTYISAEVEAPEDGEWLIGIVPEGPVHVTWSAEVTLRH